MERYQECVQKAGFFQQNIPDYAPDWLDRITVPKEGGTVTHIS
jgi:bifunctional non-homologous end joining protein LigD